MLSVLVTGQLVGDPKERTATTGRPYVTVSLRTPTEDEPVLVSIIAFSNSARQALSALSRGDSVAVTGRAKLTSWDKDGETRFGMSVVAEHVMTLYQFEKRRKAAAPEAAGASPRPAAQRTSAPREALAEQRAGSVAEMTDDLPWG